MNSMKKQKDRTLKDELPRLVGAQHATVDQWRNNFRKNEEMEPKQKQHPVVCVTGDGSKVWCYKEQYCIGTWNVRSMNQGILEVVKQMARVNSDILGISKLKWTGMGEFNSDDHYIYYCGQESLRRNGVAIIVNKRVWNAVLRGNLKNDKMISVHFQGKPFTITVIQVYALTSNAEEAEQFYEDLQDLLELTPKKRCPFHYRGLECKSRKSRDTWSNRQVWPWSRKGSRANVNRVLPRACTGPSNHLLPTTQEMTLHMDIIRWSILKSDWLYSLQPKMEKFYACMLSCFSHVWLFVAVWTIPCQVALSIGFSRQEYWSGLSFLSPGGKALYNQQKQNQ